MLQCNQLKFLLENSIGCTRDGQVGRGRGGECRGGGEEGRISPLSCDGFKFYVLDCIFVAQICCTSVTSISERVHQWCTISFRSIPITHIIVFDIADKSFCQNIQNSLYALFVVVVGF